MMSHEKTISDLAYHLWNARGRPMGSPEIDWAEALRQVNGRPPGAQSELQPDADPGLTQSKTLAQR